MLHIPQDNLAIANGFNHHYTAAAAGWLSLKSMFNGAALYQIEGGRFVVNDHTYLILNDRQPYKMQIRSDTVVETFCLFFPAAWAGDVLRSLITPADKLLDEPNGETAVPVSFFECLHPHDPIVTPHLMAMRAAWQNGTADMAWYREKAYDLLAGMLQVQRNVYREVERLTAVRQTTRLELYRRLHRARDYIHAHLHEAPSLAEMAQIACLSPYHFLRTFKQLFGQTPHAYLTQKRLEKAQFLLARTDKSVTDICFEVGFRSVGPFSSLFSRHLGLSPRTYRQQHHFKNKGPCELMELTAA